jgi:hypothetical protein
MEAEMEQGFQYLSEVISFVLGAVCGYGIKILFDSRKSRISGVRTTSGSHSVNQAGNIVGGDQAARDIKR